MTKRRIRFRGAAAGRESRPRRARSYATLVEFRAATVLERNGRMLDFDDSVRAALDLGTLEHGHPVPQLGPRHPSPDPLRERGGSRTGLVR